MKLIDLSFREEAFEREFGVEKRNCGEKILRGYICIVLIELLMIGISMASEPSYASQDGPFAVISGAQLVLAACCQLLSSRVSIKGFNLLVCAMNIIQALVACAVVSTMGLFAMESGSEKQMDTWRIVSVCVCLAGSVFLKHTCLLIGSNFYMKMLTMSSIAFVYIMWSVNHKAVRLTCIGSVGIAFLLLHLMKAYFDDVAMRSLYLNKRKFDEMNMVVQKLLPVSVMITRYDKKKEAVQLHKSNLRLQKAFHVKDDESMKSLFKKITLFSESNQGSAAAVAASTSIGGGMNPFVATESLFKFLHLKAKQYAKCVPSLTFLGKRGHSNSNGIVLNSQSPTAGHFQQPVYQPRGGGRNSTGIQTIAPTNPVSHIEPSSNDFRMTSLPAGLRFSVGNYEDSITTPRAGQYISQQKLNGGVSSQSPTKVGVHSNNINNPTVVEGQQNDDHVLSDRLDACFGIIQSGKQKVIIFEEETLRGRVDFLTKLNKYYIQLFQGMLKKMRVPIASSLYRMKKSINTIKSSQQTQQIPQLLQNSNIEQYSHQISATQIICPPFQPINFSIPSQNTLDNNNLIALNQFEIGSIGISAIEDQIQNRVQITKKEQLLFLVEDLQFCSFNILNNLFNFQDIFTLFSKGSLSVKADHLSLERIISDLKAIFQPEFISRQLTLQFINEISVDESFINTDEKYLKQVLINLITNSLNALSTQQTKGHAEVLFKLNEENDEIIEIVVSDNGPGFGEDNFNVDKMVLTNLNFIGLEKNLSLKDIRVGLCISEKIVGKLGPYEKIIVKKNMVRFQIYKDYDGLLMQKQQDCSHHSYHQINSFFQKEFKSRKSLFGQNNKDHKTDGDVLSDLESDRLPVQSFQHQSLRHSQLEGITPLHARDAHYMSSP